MTWSSPSIEQPTPPPQGPGREDVAKVLEDAREKVRPTIEREAQGENVAEIMGFSMKGLNQKETFDFLLARHQKLLEIEAATPAPDAAGERPRAQKLARKYCERINELIRGSFVDLVQFILDKAAEEK